MAGRSSLHEVLRGRRKPGRFRDSATTTIRTGGLKEAARLVPEETLRIWRLYLAGCAYGFKRGWINLHQILAIRPHEDGSHELPWSRRDLYA